MRSPKPYDHDATYRRRKLREQAWQYYNNYPAGQEHRQDATIFIILAIVAIIALSMFFFTLDSSI